MSHSSKIHERFLRVLRQRMSIARELPAQRTSTQHVSDSVGKETGVTGA